MLTARQAIDDNMAQALYVLDN